MRRLSFPPTGSRGVPAPSEISVFAHQFVQAVPGAPCGPPIGPGDFVEEGVLHNVQRALWSVTRFKGFSANER